MLKRSQYDALIPGYTLDSLIRYAERGVPTGGFLEAVLSNDLMDALRRADDRNRAALGAICRFVQTEMPADCHGSRQRFQDWVSFHAVNA